MKNNRYFVLMVVFGLVSVVLIGYIVYDKVLEYSFIEDSYESSINSEVNNTEESCTFTRTHHIVDLLEDYRGEVPESTFILVDHYQDHYPQVLHIPNTMRDGLEVNKNYEFTYTILRGNDYESENDILDDLVGDVISNNFEIDLVIRETDRLGLEQNNESICK